jgi:hypothetical protein
MFDVIGETAVQQTSRAGLYGSGTEKDVVVQKAERGRAARPVEKSTEGEKSRAKNNGHGDTHSRTRLEEGQIVIEKYDEDGRLVKKTPPGYLPFGERV